MSPRCLHCNALLEAKPPERTGRQPAYCNRTCGERWRRRGGGGRPAARVLEDMGPAIPLDGVSPEERVRQRDAKVVRLLAEGLPTDAVAERLGLTQGAVCTIAREAGHPVTRREDLLPWGLPA